MNRSAALLVLLLGGVSFAGTDEFGNWVDGISDLSATDVDTLSLNLRWTAPAAQNMFAGKYVAPDAYEIRYSTVFPGYEYSFEDLTVADAAVPTPEVYGAKQVAAVSSLLPDRSYWFMVRVTYGQAQDFSPLLKVTTASDLVLPGMITTLAATALSESSVQLSWTAPGDDGSTGTATRYEIRYATTGPIESIAAFSAAKEFATPPFPAPAGTSQGAIIENLAPDTPYWFAIRAYDEVMNGSLIAPTSASATTLPAPPDSGGGKRSCGGSASGSGIAIALLAAALLLRR